MANWGPKVTQLAPLTSLDLKGVAVTMPDPIRHPWRRSAQPGATHRVRNTHTDQGGSHREGSLYQCATYSVKCRRPVWRGFHGGRNDSRLR